MEIIIKYRSLIYVILIIVLNLSCNRIYNNPYDPQTPSDIWKPTNLELIVDDSNSVRVIWEHEEDRIDGFILTNNNYPINEPVIIEKDQNLHFDNSNFIVENCGYDFDYSIKAFAGNNESDEANYSSCGNTFVSTMSISNVKSKSIFIEGNVFSTSSISNKGFCWSKSPNPTINSNKVNLGSNLGSYNSLITNLDQNTVYYIRAFATYSNEVFYGRELEFTTLEIVLPTITTSNITNITFNSAICGGNLTNNGNSDETVKGLCWSTSTNPTYNSTNSTNEGIGSGSFSSTINNLTPSTTYYLKAYAQNESGTAYGNEKSFTTLAEPPPTGPCNISSVTTGPNYSISIQNNQNIFNFLDDITIQMISSSFSFGQASSVDLYINETYIHSFGSWVVFNNNSRTFTLPSSSQISASNCYTIRVFNGSLPGTGDVYITNSFTIY